jgi:hypothetical protein
MYPGEEEDASGTTQTAPTADVWLVRFKAL